MARTQTTALSHPSGDKRFAILDATIRRHGHRRDSLIEVLHVAQEQFGYLATDVLAYVARALDLPPSRVYGVATFYNFFTLEAQGQHRCVVCVGTACYVKSAADMASSLERELGVGPHQTTTDQQVAFDVARCLGSCGLAPVVLLDDQLLGKVDIATVLQRVRQWRAEMATESPPAAAGAPR